MQLTAPTHRRQRGASLIEVLVSILVIAFGVIAMAAVQSNTMKFHKTSEFRATANLLAADLADRMRANVAGATADGYRWATTAYNTPALSPGQGNSCGSVTAGVLSACSGAELAQKDLAEWQTRLSVTLPQASGHVAAYDATTNAIDLWVAWSDPAETDRGGNGLDQKSPECPASWSASNSVYHCVFLRVAL